MSLISHEQALKLEYLVRDLYHCDRGGVSGLADADNFEYHPLDAAIMVVSFILARDLQIHETQYDQFLSQYYNVFTSPDEYDTKKEAENYIKELTRIVDLAIRSL